MARLAGAPPGRIEALLERLGLDSGLLRRRPDAVSGGELQRLALLVRLAFVFADEPTSRLDPITRANVIALLGEAAERDGGGDDVDQPRRGTDPKHGGRRPVHRG